MENNIEKELNRLKFEDILWIIFGVLCFINVYGDSIQEKNLFINSSKLERKSNNVFTLTLIITFLIYVYFFTRNYNSYKKATLNNKNLYAIKVLGSSFLIAGVICLIYFQTNNKNFIGAPSL